MSLEALKKIGKNVLPCIVIFCVTYLMIRFQINSHATFVTSDRFLHFSRFYDTMMQIKTGNFSYFQTNYGMDACGRVFNAVYGPFFAYINGFLLLICQTWYNYQILTIFLVNLIGGMGMYYLCKKIKVNDLLAIFLAILYLQFGIIVGFLRANNFMGWGAAIAPYILLQAVNMVQDSERPIHWLALAVGMSILGQIHILSVLIMAMTLVPFFLYALIKSNNKKQVIIDLLKAIGLTLLLTANIWGGYLYIALTNKLALPQSFHMSSFTFKVSKTSLIYQHGKISGGFVLLMLFQLIYVIRHFKNSHLNTLITLWSLSIILVSSKYFPWNSIESSFPVLSRNFQFPYRLAVGAIPLILLGIGITFNNIFKEKNIVKQNCIVFALLLVTLQFFTSGVGLDYFYTSIYNDPNEVIITPKYYTMTKQRKKFYDILEKTNSGELFELMSHISPDYMPVDTAINEDNYGQGIIKAQKHYHRSVSGDKLILTWHSNKKQTTELPLVMYHQSKLLVNGENETDISKTAIGQPIVMTKKGENRAVLSFEVSPWFWALFGVTLCSWIVLIVYGITYLIKHWVK